MKWSSAPAGEFIKTLPEDVVSLHALQGKPLTPLVRCKDCKKTDRSPAGLVCKRFGAFYHLTDPQGFCHEGEQWRNS